MASAYSTRLFKPSVTNSHQGDVDPDTTFHFGADPDLSFHFDADSERTFQFDMDPDPHQSDANLRPLICRPSMAPCRSKLNVHCLSSSEEFEVDQTEE